MKHTQVSETDHAAPRPRPSPGRRGLSLSLSGLRGKLALDVQRVRLLQAGRHVDAADAHGANVEEALGPPAVSLLVGHARVAATVLHLVNVDVLEPAEPRELAQDREAREVGRLVPVEDQQRGRIVPDLALVRHPAARHRGCGAAKPDVRWVSQHPRRMPQRRLVCAEATRCAARLRRDFAVRALKRGTLRFCARVTPRRTSATAPGPAYCAGAGTPATR
eukprot:6972967-Prymnesium_polylepis.3